MKSLSVDIEKETIININRFLLIYEHLSEINCPGKRAWNYIFFRTNQLLLKHLFLPHKKYQTQYQ